MTDNADEDRLVINSEDLAEGPPEGQADEEPIRRCPHLADTRIVPICMVIRCRKPEA